MFPKALIILFSTYGLMSVLMGAIGSHALSSRILPEKIETYKLAVYFGLIHSIFSLLLVLIQIQIKETFLLISSYFFSIGIFLFSGTLYLIALGLLPKSINYLTPVGGFTLILGWICLIIFGITFKQSNQ